LVSHGHYQVAEVLIMNTAFSATPACFLHSKVQLLQWSRPIRPFGRVREVNLQFGTLQASGRVSKGQLMEIKEEIIRDLGNLVVVAGWSSTGVSLYWTIFYRDSVVFAEKLAYMKEVTIAGFLPPLTHF
jgi:hypothetical protein